MKDQQLGRKPKMIRETSYNFMKKSLATLTQFLQIGGLAGDEVGSENRSLKTEQ